MTAKMTLGYLSINLTFGNDAMQTHYDAAKALEAVIRDLRHDKDSGPIRDANGNRVGEFEVTYV